MMEIKSSKIVWVFALFLYILLYIINSGQMQPYIIIGSSIITFVVYAALMKKAITFRPDALIFYYVILCLFCYVSSIWALNSRSLSISMGNSLLVNFAPFIVIYIIFNDCLGIRDLLKLIQWGNYFILGYAILAYGWRAFVYAIQNETRVTNDYLNANVMGMCAVYAIVINIYFILYEGFKVLDIIIIPAIIILAASGSRTALIILIVGIFAIFILRNFTKRRLLQSMLRILLVIVSLSILLVFMLNSSIFEGLNLRISGLITTLTQGVSEGSSGGRRIEYMILGLQLFSQYPILGIGIDNAKPITQRIYGQFHYLHNNYVELLACGGLAGFTIYYSVYAYIFYIMIKYRNKRDGEWDICMVLLIIRLIADIGTVSYSTRGTYVFILLLWLEVKKLKKEGENVSGTK